MPNKEDKIYRVLSQIEKSLEKQNSTKRVFFQGLIRGLATALGATVILAIITLLTIQLSSAVDMDTIMNYLFNNVVVE